MWLAFQGNAAVSNAAAVEPAAPAAVASAEQVGSPHRSKQHGYRSGENLVKKLQHPEFFKGNFCHFVLAQSLAKDGSP